MTICYAPVGTNIPIIIKCYDWNRIPLDAGIYNPNSLSVKHYTLRLDFNFGKIMALVHIQVGLWRGLRWGEMGLAGKTRPVRKCPGGCTPRSRGRTEGPLVVQTMLCGLRPHLVPSAQLGRSQWWLCSDRSYVAASPNPTPECSRGRPLNEKPKLTFHDKGALKVCLAWIQYSSPVRHFLLHNP